VELALYTALKAHIISELPEIKSVRLWNNQINREEDENAFLYPIVFLQFQPLEFRELSQGVQQFDMIVTTHLGFESYKDEDTYVLELKQKVFKAVNRFRNEYFSRLLRVAERPNFDHPNIQVYETDFRTTGKDFTTDIRPTITTIIDPEVTGEIIDITEL
jgi:hypothetical protein